MSQTYAVTPELVNGPKHRFLPVPFSHLTLSALISAFAICAWACGPQAQAGQIASMIQTADGGVDERSDDLAPGAILFDGPWGDGRNKATGVVINAVGFPGSGSRWSFRWQRDGSGLGLQVFHPFGDGQVIINLASDGVHIRTPQRWVENGYCAITSDTPVTCLPEFARQFPLQGDNSFVSSLDPDGHYALRVNGGLVATATLTTAFPISFDIDQDERFRGSSGWAELKFTPLGPESFPSQWGTGNAGLLLEPRDWEGTNVVHDVQFSVVSVPLPAVLPSGLMGLGLLLLARRVPLRANHHRREG